MSGGEGSAGKWRIPLCGKTTCQFPSCITAPALSLFAAHRFAKNLTIFGDYSPAPVLGRNSEVAPGAEKQPPREVIARPRNPSNRLTCDPEEMNPSGEGEYVPAAQLDRRIQLLNGRVGCLSCHDIFGRQEKLLAVPNDSSRLCYACHRI